VKSDSTILARCLYEQAHRIGQRWSELTPTESDLWIDRAGELINKLDLHGYRLSYIPPEM
jgi:hypothetical protein